MGNKKRRKIRVLFIPGELRTTVTAAKGLRTGHNGLALIMVMGRRDGWEKTRVISCYKTIASTRTPSRISSSDGRLAEIAA